MKTYEALRKQYQQFIYHGFEVEDDEEKVVITYDFEIPGLSSFAPSWEIPLPDSEKAIDRDDDVFLNLAFSLGMVELISYWKIACPKEVIIEPCGLDEEQIAWWKRLYFNGLGEFYYTNGIEEDQEGFMEITAKGKAWHPKKKNGKLTGDGCLIPVGGGKDSAVTLDILRSRKDNNYCYIINSRAATLDTAAVSDYDLAHIIDVRRTLDKRMLQLNEEGYLNGHTPFSAIVAFSATLTAYLYGLTYIPLSNESSANESTVKDSYVNHQYSKSFQFESDFHNYEKKYLASGTYYFSLLRPLSEFQIAAYFSKVKKYHELFRSCNAGSKRNIWCCNCPKCLFVWLILSPFLSQPRLKEIFGINMANKLKMEDDFRKLIGLDEEKPFECVGSRDEINCAITLAIRDYPKGVRKPALFYKYKRWGMYDKYLADCEKYFYYYDHENLLPEEFEELFIQELKKRGAYRDSNGKKSDKS
ncbi:MAG: hypothetical protein J1E61_04720 [Lachnospiraceae bacterium]|nr:hypothetical protein [Lachnospiraceae bacterium]